MARLARFYGGYPSPALLLFTVLGRGYGGLLATGVLGSR